jgi:hypothetical protein
LAGSGLLLYGRAELLGMVFLGGLGGQCSSVYGERGMSNIIPFPKKEANTATVIYSDYWGMNKIPVNDLLAVLDEAKKQNGQDPQSLDKI